MLREYRSIWVLLNASSFGMILHACGQGRI